MKENIINWDIIQNEFNFKILHNPRNNKYYLLEDKKLSKPYDNVECIFNKKQEIFVFTKNNQRAIYISNKGFVTNFNCLEIMKRVNTFIIKQNSGYQFMYIGAYGNDIKLSEVFQNIKYQCIHYNDSFNNRYSDILYCYSDKEIMVYCGAEYSCKLLCKTKKYDDITAIAYREPTDYSINEDNLDLEILFRTKKDNLYGLINNCIYTTNITTKNVLNEEYNDINYQNGGQGFRNIKLTKNDKIGMYSVNSGTETLINSDYNKIKPILDNKLFICHKNDELCDIVFNNKIIVDNCKIIKILNNNIIFKKQNINNLLTIEPHSYKIIADINDVNKIKDNFYMIKREKLGLLKDLDFLLEPQYNDIKVYQNIIVAKKENKYYIYNYQGLLLKTCYGNLDICEINAPYSNVYKYLINSMLYKMSYLDNNYV